MFIFDHASLDWGGERCGLAFGSSATGLVVPFQEYCNISQAVDIIIKQIKKRGVEKLIVGMPLNFDSNPTEVSKKIELFVTKLKNNMEDKELSVEVSYYDERSSTKKAATNNTSGSDMIDNLAAAEILKSYFQHELKL